MSDGNSNLIDLTASIVAAHVAHNSVHVGDLPALIANVHGALSGLGAPAPAEPQKPKGAVSPRASIKPDGLISMIDGKKYKTLRRHIARHGYTPESYRTAFDLPESYPFVSAEYSEARRSMAKSIGLGRKKAPAPAPVVEAEPAPKPAKATRKPRAAKAATAPEPVVEQPAAKPARKPRAKKAAPAK